MGEFSCGQTQPYPPTNSLTQRASATAHLPFEAPVPRMSQMPCVRVGARYSMEAQPIGGNRVPCPACDRFEIIVIILT
jgi:hypothetical protein